MSVLGNGLTAAGHDEDSLTVQEARLSLMRRLEDSEGNILIVQTCLANSLMRLGRNEQASNMLRDIYSARVRLNGEEHRDTIIAALNYASSLGCLRRVEEVKSLLRKTIPAARRVLGENNEITLRVKLTYVTALGLDTGAWSRYPRQESVAPRASACAGVYWHLRGAPDEEGAPRSCWPL